MVEAWLSSTAAMDEHAARESAKQEVESLEQFIEHERVSQQWLQDEADKQGASIDKLEAELAELRDNVALM